MLDENLPSFQFKQSQDNPLQSPIYFSQNGSEPAPEFIFERAHPSTNPAAARKYAVALKDPYHTDVVYAEVVVSPTWQQPTLSAAEVRAQQGQNGGGARLQPTPLIPDTFTIQLYEPDQTVTVRYVPSSLTKTDSFEFEMLSQGFKMPTPSQLDRQNDEPRADFRPRIMFKWKRDSRLSKDMTCYNVGRSLGKHKSKEPDITIALFKMSRESAITVYEPNLQRVEMEDRKGLDIVLVIGAEVIRDLWLAPEKKADLFNMGTGAPVAIANGKRKNSRPSPPPAESNAPRPGATGNVPPMTMSGALGPVPPTTSTANVPATYNSRPKDTTVDAETERLRKMVDEEKRRARLEAAEREKRDREEAKRIEKMLKKEENDKRRRQAEVDQETERLRKLYGTQGQDMPSTRLSPQNSNSRIPPRQQVQFQGPPPAQQQQPAPSFAPPPQQRPLSVGPGATGPFNHGSVSNFFNRPSAPPQQQTTESSRPSGRPSQGQNQSGNTIAAVSGFLQNVLESKKKPVIKKRSMHW
ncbi:unnamed protein product [Discula destructiva]